MIRPYQDGSAKDRVNHVLGHGHWMTLKDLAASVGLAESTVRPVLTNMKRSRSVESALMRTFHPEFGTHQKVGLWRKA